jgi:hypothetical protein
MNFFNHKMDIKSSSFIFMSSNFIPFYSFLRERQMEWGEPGGWEEEAPFQRNKQLSVMPADDRDSGTAQLLGNGGKIEPYTIIIMRDPLG